MTKTDSPSRRFSSFVWSPPAVSGDSSRIAYAGALWIQTFSGMLTATATDIDVLAPFGRASPASRLGHALDDLRTAVVAVAADPDLPGRRHRWVLPTMAASVGMSPGPEDFAAAVDEALAR